MKILIINLPRHGRSSIVREGRCEMVMDYRVDTPATLLIIASILKKIDHKIDFIDANGFNLSYKDIYEQIKHKNYDFVIFTIASFILEHDLKICTIIKKLNSKIITIGYSWYARKYAREILEEYQNFDILIIEDPFSVIENLISFLCTNQNLENVDGIAYRDINNQIKINFGLKAHKRFEDLPIPAYDLLKSFKPYYIYSPLLKPYALIYAGKGCPFSCRYCNVANTKYTGRTANQIIEELKTLKVLGNIKYVWFFDEIFTLKKKRIIQLCNRILEEKINIKWLCDSRVDLVDFKLLKLMRKAGCIGISYGLESGSQKILDLMNKGITIEQAKNALLWTKKVGIPVQLNLIVGYMGENAKTLKESENFINETIPNFLQITKMMPLADTEFYDYALEKGWIIEEVNWQRGLESPKTKMKNFKPFELDLYGEMKRLRKKLYYNPKWWILSIKTLVKNPYLLYLTLGTMIKKSYDKSII